MKPVGEPDAGNRHVRFDERGWETERCQMAQATAPILDSTVSTECDVRRPVGDLGMNRHGADPARGQVVTPSRHSTSSPAISEYPIQ
jgi:hypothetical protein